ncbi:cobaltochelatase CobT-related protein [Desulfovibrio falkowii]
MIRTKDVLNCLPLLASVLGDQYGVQVRIGGKQACTNGKTIYLPSLPMDCEPELLALAKGFCDHEAAHIRHTDFDVLKAANFDPVTFNLFNCLEDWRVEKKLSAIFPGCRQNLNWLIRRFFVEKVEPGAGGDSPALAVMEYVLLTVRSWDVDEVNSPRRLSAETIAQNFPNLKEALDAVLVKVRMHCPDTTSAIGYADQLASCIRKWKPKRLPTRSGSTSAKPGNSSEKQQRSQVDCATQSGQSASSICTSQSQQKESKDKRALLADLFKTDACGLPQNLGEALAEQLILQQEEARTNCLSVAVEGFRQVLPLAVEHKNKSLSASSALRTRLQGLLQAQTRQRCHIGRKGILHTRSLYKLHMGNSHVFQSMSEQTGLNTAVHILLDVSGSMGGAPISLAKQACYAIARALAGIKGINPAVTAFPATTEPNSVVPLVRHGQTVSENFEIGASGGTPLAAALWWVMQKMLPLKEQRKMILIITDGTSDNPQASKDALTMALKLGFEVYGLGIRDESIANLLPHDSQTIKELTDLAPAMFGLLQQALLKGGKNG